MSTDLLSLEHPSVLLFCLSGLYRYCNFQTQRYKRAFCSIVLMGIFCRCADTRTIYETYISCNQTVILHTISLKIYPAASYGLLLHIMEGTFWPYSYNDCRRKILEKLLDLKEHTGNLSYDPKIPPHYDEGKSVHRNATILKTWCRYWMKLTHFRFFYICVYPLQSTNSLGRMIHWSPP